MLRECLVNGLRTSRKTLESSGILMVIWTPAFVLRCKGAHRKHSASKPTMAPTPTPHCRDDKEDKPCVRHSYLNPRSHAGSEDKILSFAPPSLPQVRLRLL